MYNFGHKKLLLFGTGGHSTVVASVASKWYTEIKAIDDTYNIVSTGEWLNYYNTNAWDAFPAIGNNIDRERIFNKLKCNGFNIPNIISSSAYIAPEATLSEGIYIGPMAVIQADTAIYNGAIINTSASVDHDCIIKSFTHIAPGSHICGHVTIGDRCLLGVGSSVIPNTTIANDCIIGAGAAVVNSVTMANTKMLGVPARSSFTESG